MPRKTITKSTPGRLPRAVEEYRNELRVKQACILHRYTDYIERKLNEQGDKYFDTQVGMQAVDNMLKLELKDRQIQANRVDNGERNNVLLEAIRRAQQLNDDVDRKSERQLKKEIILEATQVMYTKDDIEDADTIADGEGEASGENS